MPRPIAEGTIIAAAASPAENRRVLQQAIDAAKTGDNIGLRDGTYELDAPLRLSRGVSLVGDFQGKSVLSGGRRLDLDWRSHAGGVMRANLPDDLDLEAVAFDQLYVNGSRLHLARFPNHAADQARYGGTSADALSDERVATWTDPAGGFIHALHQAEWGGDHWRVLGKRPDGSLDLEGGWMNNRPSGIHPTLRFVENVAEELDAPGEWFLDRGQRVLDVYPPDGVDLASAEVVASAIAGLVTVVGDNAIRPAAGGGLRGLDLAYTARTFMQTDEPLLRSDWMIHRGGAVYLENVRNFVVLNCRLHRLGGNGVFVSGFAHGVSVAGCHVHDVGASGVCFVGKPEAVRSPSFRYEQFVDADELDTRPGPKTEDYPRDCKVDNCLMHDLGTVEKQVAGVQLSMASRITVRQVSIYDVPRAGINISEGTWGGHLIEGCDVFDTVQMTGDHGSFNGWGRDRFWHPTRSVMDRLVAERPELTQLDAIETTVIRNCRWRCDHGWDIDLDDGCSNYTIYNNLCLNGGIKLREGFRRQVFNNIMINNSFHPHVWFPESHDVFERNIVTTWYQPIRVQGWGERVDHNLLPDADALRRSHDLGLDVERPGGRPVLCRRPRRRLPGVRRVTGVGTGLRELPDEPVWRAQAAVAGDGPDARDPHVAGPRRDRFRGSSHVVVPRGEGPAPSRAQRPLGDGHGPRPRRPVTGRPGRLGGSRLGVRRERRHPGGQRPRHRSPRGSAGGLFGGGHRSDPGAALPRPAGAGDSRRGGPGPADPPVGARDVRARPGRRGGPPAAAGTRATNSLGDG